MWSCSRSSEFLSNFLFAFTFILTSILCTICEFIWKKMTTNRISAWVNYSSRSLSREIRHAWLLYEQWGTRQRAFLYSAHCRLDYSWGKWTSFIFIVTCSVFVAIVQYRYWVILWSPASKGSCQKNMIDSTIIFVVFRRMKKRSRCSNGPEIKHFFPIGLYHGMLRPIFAKTWACISMVSFQTPQKPPYGLWKHN